MARDYSTPRDPEPPLSVAAARARASAAGRRWALAVSLVVLGSGVADAVSTSMALGLAGAVEANPLVKALQDALGQAWVAPKLALHGALAALVAWYPNGPTLATMAAVGLITFAVSAHNVSVYVRLAG